VDGALGHVRLWDDDCHEHVGAIPVTGNQAVRDSFELLFVIAAGGMLWSAVGRLRRGEITVVRCSECGRPCSNAYAVCKHCGAPRP
jgi:hypothetical protein